MALCEHATTARIAVPSSSAKVYKDECTNCFDTPDCPDGLDVCLTCYNGGCVAPPHQHAKLHAEKFHHPYVVNIRRLRKDAGQVDLCKMGLRFNVSSARDNNC